MKHLSLVSFSLALSGVTLAGCGGGGSAVHSEVDGNKKGSELSAEELDQVCEATLNYLEEQVDVTESTCKIAGILGGAIAAALGGGDEEIQTTCSDAVDACQNNDAVQEGTDNLTCDDTPDSAPDCDVTVAEYEHCMTDAVNVAADWARSIPKCDSLTEENVDQASDTVRNRPDERPPSCDVVEDACPNALDSLYQ